MFDTVTEAFRNQQASFEKIVNALKVERDLSYHPLFQVSFNLLPSFQQSSLEIGDLHGRVIDSSSATPEFDLAFMINDVEKKYEGLITYNAKIFKAGSKFKTLKDHYLYLIEEMIKNPQLKSSELNILNEPEKQKILMDWNATEKNFPRNKTIHQLFEEQVEKTPNNIALVFGDQTLTY